MLFKVYISSTHVNTPDKMSTSNVEYKNRKIERGFAIHNNTIAEKDNMCGGEHTIVGFI